MGAAIKTRPDDGKGFSRIPDKEKDMLAVSVAFGWSNSKVFGMFHPEFIGRNGKLSPTGKKQCDQFFGLEINKTYMEAYRKTLGAPAETAGIGEALEIDDSRKDKALKSLFHQAISLVEGKDTLDADTLKIATEIFKKIGLLKDDVEENIKPIRFLPTLCKKACRYRLFCESAISEGAMFDECQYCKARKMAEQNGFKYDPTKLLDIPDEVIEEIDSKNNVRLLDILDGKIEN